MTTSFVFCVRAYVRACLSRACTNATAPNASTDDVDDDGSVGDGDVAAEGKAFRADTSAAFRDEVPYRNARIQATRGRMKWAKKKKQRRRR